MMRWIRYGKVGSMMQQRCRNFVAATSVLRDLPFPQLNLVTWRTLLRHVLGCSNKCLAFSFFQFLVYTLLPFLLVGAICPHRVLKGSKWTSKLYLILFHNFCISTILWIWTPLQFAVLASVCIEPSTPVAIADASS